MKYFIVLVLMVAMISVMLTAPVRQLAETYDHSQLEKLWSDFKTKFNKQYKDTVEELKRFLFLLFLFSLLIVFRI